MQAALSHRRGAADADPTALQKVMGSDWHRLHPSVQARFAREPADDHPVVYGGVMETVACSPAGWLFAQATRLIGNPLAPDTGRNIAMTVTLTPRAGGVAWQRLYGFRKPFRVTSVKRTDAHGRLCEYVGFGFGMRLDVSARDGALHFVSTRYFWEVAGRQIPLPHWLSPGRTHVVHEDLGGGEFRFTITMDHRWLGRTFYQTGRFREVLP